jgi:HAE1 family hydrophobic/amphiphilic exporter-1
MDTDEIDVELEMARGTSIAVAKVYLDELESLVRSVLPEGDVESVATQVRGDGDAEVEVRLKPASERSAGPSELADRIRGATAGRIPGAEVRVEPGSGLWVLRRLFSAGGSLDAIELQLRGYDLDRSRELAADIQRRIQGIEGVVEVNLEQREGRPEENLRFDRAKIYNLGLSVEQVGRAVQLGVGGRRAGYFREGGDQFPIMVRLRPEDRLTRQDLGGIAVRGGERGLGIGPGVVLGGAFEDNMIPVSALVRREEGRGPTEIRHIDGRRVTYITADLEGDLALGEAIDRIRERLSGLALPEGVSLEFGGAYREQLASQRAFLIAIALALALVYMVMAGQFERFLDPLVVMFSIPVALVGVVPTLLLTGTTLNVQSVMGLVMLVGIVVNNAIVLVDHLNLKRRVDGLDVRAATIEAGRTRLRPILMTTATTVLGLMPLALGLGEGAGLQAALARVVVGGLVASTAITLFLIPTVYVSATAWSERGRAALARLRHVR